MMSYPVKNSDSLNAINSLKEFCYLKGFPKIIKTYNGLEYKNNLFKDFCLNKCVGHIFSSSYLPQTNGVIEVRYKEIRKNLITILGILLKPQNYLPDPKYYILSSKVL